MSDEREKLLQLMRAMRRHVDPAVLERARAAALTGKMPAPSPATGNGPLGAAAIRQFLDARQDGGAFQRKLLEHVRQVDRATGAQPPEPPAPPAAKPARKSFWRR